METNKTILEQMTIELSKGNVSALDNLLAVDAEWHIMGYKTISSKAEIIRITESALQSYPIIAIKRIIADGPDVMIESYGKAIDKKGNARHTDYCDIYTMKEGKITAFTSYVVEKMDS